MEIPVLHASSEAIDTAFTVLQVAESRMQTASTYKAPYNVDDNHAKSLVQTVEHRAEEELTGARQNFSSAIVWHTLRLREAQTIDS